MAQITTNGLRAKWTGKDRWLTESAQLLRVRRRDVDLDAGVITLYDLKGRVSSPGRMWCRSPSTRRTY